MTDDEQKAWEELVARGIKDIGVQVHGEYMDRVILAADAELTALRARIVELEEQVRMRDEVATALEKERNVYKDFINGYGSFPCHPDCDTISHSDQCPRVDIPLAFKTLQEENKRLREAGEELRAIVHQEAEYIDVDNLTTQTKYARYRNAVSSWLKEGK